MFFYIGSNCPVKLTEVAPNLYLDDGWKKLRSRNVWYKGYSSNLIRFNAGVVRSILRGFQPRGKWCVISMEDTPKIFHPTLRGFPLFKKDDSTTNIKLAGFESIPALKILPPKNESIVTLDEAAEDIGDFLIENTRRWITHNNINYPTMLYTGGLDSLTSWAVLDHVTKNYKLDVYLPKKTDQTFHQLLGREREMSSDFIDTVSKANWGYDVLSIYKKFNWCVTGYYSERMQLREGDNINAMANYFGKTIKTISKDTDYLHKFLQRPSTDKYLNTTLTFANETELKNYMFASIFDDHQMWHIHRNFHFCPFNDIRIARTVYHMTIDNILANSLNGLIQRMIVQRLKPELLTLVSNFKNEGRVFENFRNNFKNITLDPQVKVNVR